MMQKKKYSLIFVFIFLVSTLVLFYACEREFLSPYDDEISDNWPVLNHDSIYVDFNKIIAKATITKSKSKLVQRGYCWSDNAMPTIADSKIEVGESDKASSFQAGLLNLVANKTYHFRAFATNLSRTAYSNDVIFKPQLVLKITNITFSAPDITTISGYIKGTYLQGINMAEYGVCYSTNNSPTIADARVSLGTFKRDSLFSC